MRQPDSPAASRRRILRLHGATAACQAAIDHTQGGSLTNVRGTVRRTVRGGNK